jgi:DNA-binding NtrC family response regulator
VGVDATDGAEGMRLQVICDHDADTSWLARVFDGAKRAGIDTSGKQGERCPIVAVLSGTDELAGRRALQTAVQQGVGDDGLFVLRTPACPIGVFELIAIGATDVLETDETDPIGVIAALVARIARWWAVENIATSDPVRHKLIGNSPTWHSILRRVVEVASFSDASVLITGETGTGKELVAQLVHDLDRRSAKRQFALLDCTTIVPSLSGVEMFGHERGAYTGADRARTGAIAEADGGTLFLDEVGELPLALQAEFLRVLQEGTYKPVGSSQWKHARFRLVSATNRSLADASLAGTFRTDLFYRLAAVEIALPRLNDRSGDISVLARHFLRTLFPKGGPEPDAHVDAYLTERPYRGNVRELRQLVTNMAVRYPGRGPLTLGTLPPCERDLLGRFAKDRQSGDRCNKTIDLTQGTDKFAGPPTEPGTDVTSELESAVGHAIADGMQIAELRSLVTDFAQEAALSKVGGNVTQAARTLGLSRRALQAARSKPVP